VKRTEQLYVDQEPRWIEHPTLGAKADFVALPLSQLGDVLLLPQSLELPTPALAISPAEPVSVIGFPFGLSAGGAIAIWATGFFATEPFLDFEGMPVLLIDCRSRPGQSGSPVAAVRYGSATLDDGSTMMLVGSVERFVGIYSGRINEQSDLGIVWKASAIVQLVASI